MGKHKKLFCFGYGYTCDYLGHALQEIEGWDIYGTTRDVEKKKSLRARGVQAFLFDYTRPLTDPLMHLQDTTHLLISTPADDRGDPAFQIHAEDIIRLPSLEWVGYLSTTAVYGDRNGEWIDESAAVNPTSKRGSRRLRVENNWLELANAHNLPLHIFRLSGIYGPGRSALDSVRAGVARRIEKEGHAFNRIHVEDIVQVLMASMENPSPMSIYNLADNNPVASHEVIAYACHLLGYAPPPLIPFEEADMAPIARSFYKDNKRILNDKIKEELGVVLKYPDFKSGLDGCFAAEEYARANKKSPFTGV